MLKLSEQQSEKLVSQLAGIITIIAKAAGVPDVSEEPATGMRYEELAKAARREYDPCPFGADFPETPAEPQPVEYTWEAVERAKRERMMSRLCGRWTPGANRCGVEIVRRGNHLTLNYLKRNGCLHDERFVLLWFDDESLAFYGHGDQRVSVTLDVETDTLMISPGVDYTRVVEAES